MNLPNDLLESVGNGTCVPFLGSGLSVPAGMPSWADFLNRLVTTGEEAGLITNGDELKQEIRAGRYLDVSEYIRARLGPSNYSRALRRVFSASAEPTRNHEIIVDTPYRGLVTTNYDKILETAYTLRWRRLPRTITWSEPASLGTALYDKEFFLFKLHGDIDDPSSMILTRRDYDEIMFRSPHMRALLQAILLTNTLFFVGYSMSDPDFEMMMAEVSLIFKGSTVMNYALLSNVSASMLENLKSRMNIQVISYDPHDDHIEVTNVLETLRSAAKGNA